MATLIELIMSNSANAISEVVLNLNDLIGLPAEIYYPLGSSSIYGGDSERLYGDLPDETRNIILLSVYENTFQSLNISPTLEETFSFDEDIVWILSGKETPPREGSLVKVTINDKILEFEISYIKQDATRANAIWLIYLKPRR